MTATVVCGAEDLGCAAGDLGCAAGDLGGAHWPFARSDTMHIATFGAPAASFDAPGTHIVHNAARSAKFAPFGAKCMPGPVNTHRRDRAEPDSELASACTRRLRHSTS